MRQDDVLKILRGDPKANRPRSRNTQIDVYVDPRAGTYLTQVNGKTVEEQVGNEEAARNAAKERAARLAKLTGKPCDVNVY